ncbi:hypothetical protein CLPUN_30930 [Clostridium puniceum]|uniref:Uncharacterized protein n=1 Tax=Clostridium puniceum TaxID=29367 RepID=A0A1S8TDC7_9CLOT|nr:hypothetical protein CLPUN_30930 [Clostridium puniceum]
MLLFPEVEALSVLSLSVVEYEPLLKPEDAPALFEVEPESEVELDSEVEPEVELESELTFEPLLPLEKSPDLKPSALLELVEPVVLLEDELLLELEPLLEDLLDEPLTEPELNPLFELELPLDLLLLFELDLLPLDLAKATVLSDGVIPALDKISKGKFENANIKVKSIVKTYFFLIS